MVSHFISPNPDLRHMDMKLKKIKNPKASDLHASWIQTLARIHWCFHGDMGTSYCTVHHSCETTVTFSKPTAAWLNSRSLVSLHRGGRVSAIKTRAVVFDLSYRRHRPPMDSFPTGTKVVQTILDYMDLNVSKYEGL